MKRNSKKEKISIGNNKFLSDIKSKSTDEVTELAESIIHTVREPLLILDKDLRVVKANRAFFDYFKVSSDETIGTLIYDLGNRQWDIPELKELLEKILPEKTTFDNYEVEHDFAGIGNRILLLNARQIERAFGKEKIILLAIEDITKRKHLEESLSETSRMTTEYLDILVNHAHFPIIIWDASFVITRFNNSFEKLSGYDISEVMGKKIDFLFPENKRESTLKLLENSLREEKFEIMEIDILRKDKEIRTVLWNSANVFDKDGRIIIATIAQDINERKRVEDALKESEEIFNHFMEKSPYYVFFKDKNIRSLRLSANYEQMLGKPLNSILGKTMDELFPSELAKKMIASDKEILNGRGTVLVEEEFNGRYFTTIKFPIIINDIPQYLAGFTIDITERKQAEEELNLLSARQSAILDSVPDIIMEVDINKIYTWANFAGIEFFGDDVIGKEAAVYFEGEQNTYTKVQSVFNGSENVVYLESLQRRKDGEIRLLAWRCRVLKDQNGNVTGVLSAAQDITERKRTEDALRENEKFLEETQKIAQLGSYNLDISTGIWKSSEILDSIFGIESDYDKSVEGWTSIIHPEWQQLMADYFANEVVGLRNSFDKEYKIVRKSDKTERWVHVLGELVIDKENKPIKMIGTIRDITKLKNAEREIVNLNRVYALLSNTNEAIVRIKDKQKLFDEICRIAIDNGKFKMAWIGIVNNDTNKVDVKASAGLIENYLEDINLDLNDERRSEGPAGKAITNGTNIIVNDIENDKAMLPWKENALRLGYKSCAVFPLNVLGKVIGVFSIYANQKDFFHEQEIRLLDEMAMDISFALEFFETEKKRKAVEENLRISEEQFRSLYENSTIGLYRTTPDGTILMANKVLVKMLGFSSFEELAVRNLEKDGFEQSYERKEFLEKIEKDGEINDFESVWSRQDGSKFFVRESAQAIRDSHGSTLYYDGVVEDITERKLAEEEVLASKLFIEDIINSIPARVFWKDKNLVYLGCNTIFAADAGFSSPREMIGKDDYQMGWRDQAALYREDDRNVIETGKSKLLIEEPQTTPEGKTITLLTSKIPLRDSKGEIIGLLGTYIDITERKQAEEKLREKDIQFRKLSEQVPDLIFQFTRRPDGTYFVPIASEGIKNIFGCSPEDVLEDFTPIARVIFPDDLTRVINDIEYSAKHLSLFNCEFRVKIPGKSIQWIHSKSTPEKLADGSITWYGFNTDITERKHFEDVLRENEARLNEAMQIAMLGAWEYDVDSEQFKFNDQFYKIMRTTAEREGGYFMSAMQYAQKFVHPDDMFLVGVETNKALETTDPNYYSHLDHRIIFADGEAGYVNVNIRIEKDSHGRTVKTYGVNQNITERKRAEEALQKSEERYRSVSQSAYDAIITTDSKGIIIDWNLGAQKIFGYLETEISGKKLDTIIPKDNLAQHIKNRKRSEQSGVQSVVGKTVELQGLHKNGKEFPIELSLAKWEVPSGKFFTGIVRDITERKRAEEEITMLAHSLKSINECVSITDLEDKMLFVNESFLKVYGYKENEVIGKQISMIRSLNNTTEFVDEILPATIQGEWQGELMNKRKDGSEFPVHLSTTIINDKEGTPLGLIGVASDITERKRTEKELKDSEEKFRSFAEESPNMIFINKANQVVYVNKKCEEIVGYTKKEFLDPKFNFLNLIAPEFVEMIKENFTARHKGKAKEFYEYALITKDNRRIEASISSKIINYEGGSAILGTVTDITERKLVERELIDAKKRAEYSDKLKSEFLAQMSHEIRTPLFAIVGNVDYLHESLKDKLDPDIQDCFYDIELSSKRIIRTVDLILDVSELNTSGFKPHFVKVDLDSKILNKLFHEYQRSAKQKGLDFIYRCEIKETEIFADEYSITQIFANLIDNAIKYTKKGSVKIILRKNDSDNILVEINDTGIGISGEFLPKIFDAFTQEQQGYNRSFEGNGLGLTLVKKYCDINNVHVEVKSNQKSGTTFSVIFDKKFSEENN